MLKVEIKRASNLTQLNFTGVRKYCVCEVGDASSFEKSAEVSRGLVYEATTNLLASLSPEWNETFEITGWSANKPLHFTIYDMGMLCAAKEGTAILEASQFYPQGFNAHLCLDDKQTRWLSVSVYHVGPSANDCNETVEAIHAEEA